MMQLHLQQFRPSESFDGAVMVVISHGFHILGNPGLKLNSLVVHNKEDAS